MLARSYILSSEIHAEALTNMGRVRTNNEDTFGLDEDHGLYLVCDGMGGAAGGEVASKLACMKFLESFGAQSPHGSSADELEEHMRAAIVAANSAVWREGRGDEHHNMGTTLVAAAIADKTLLIGNVGDSRAYLQRDRRWEQVTSDHSYINELVRSGSILESDRDAPELQRFGSIITRAIGAAEDVHPEFFSYDLVDGDLVLLCSDGLTRYLDEKDFDAMVDAADLETSCRQLIIRANDMGGVDNITCMLLRYTTQD
jgi:serine/threonine protein phosphatase PrpC